MQIQSITLILLTSIFFSFAACDSKNDKAVSRVNENEGPLEKPVISGFPFVEFTIMIGGSSVDYCTDITPTLDHSYLVCGITDSVDGDMNSTVQNGGFDMFTAKLGNTGDMQWIKTYGGSGTDFAYNVGLISDNTFFITGWSDSSLSGDFARAENHGKYDFALLHIGSDGTLMSAALYGADGTDRVVSPAITYDTNGYFDGLILGGITGSDDAVFPGNHGFDDVGIVKTGTNGMVEWSRCYGGCVDDTMKEIRQTADGGYIVCGITSSNLTGDIPRHDGMEGLLLIKLESLGDIEWIKVLGGSNDDEGVSVKQTTDGGYIVAATTYSDDGDVQGTPDTTKLDTWILKLDKDGDIEWSRLYGGNGHDFCKEIIQTSDGGYIFIAGTFSNDGFFAGKKGDDSTRDIWIVKLDSDGNLVEQMLIGGTGDDRPRTIKEISSGNFVIAGYTDSDDDIFTANRGGVDGFVIGITMQ